MNLNEENLFFCDPQTSGGLLIALAQNQAKEFLKTLEDEGIKAKIIAQVVDFKDKRLELI